MKKLPLLLLACWIGHQTFSQKQSHFELRSPDGNLKVSIEAGNRVSWAISHETDMILAPSEISMTLVSGEVLGRDVRTTKSSRRSADETVNTPVYKKAVVQNRYNEMTLLCRGDYGLVFRCYDDGAAYRFFTRRKGELTVKGEDAGFQFDSDREVLMPFTSDLRGGERYSCSFEEFYTDTRISKIDPDTLGYLPFLVKLDHGKKALFLEADGQDYPLMFVQRSKEGHGLASTFAPYPSSEALGGHNRIDWMVTGRESFIAKVNGNRDFPWRVVKISRSDKELLDNDMVQRLSKQSQISDTRWIQPGKVAWDWWNDWNISHVNFRAGINNDTYKHYIDFAAANGLEYIILDEGWSDDWDLMKLKPEIDLRELVEYGKQRKVGLILWSTWYAFTRETEAVCRHYAEMGIKGFKVDFFDRNDQKVIKSCYDMAAIAAQYHLMLDLHGVFPPQGLQVTWPNVVNFEGVRGMEYMKWSADDRVPQHDVSLPFIRMGAGPMDYTPGAMRNATRRNARPSNSLPMSLGTRCHQLGMYVVFEAPLQMLADNPTAYMKEQECTDFISKIPTTFDQTHAIDGAVGGFAVVARKKSDTWYIGAMNNWDSRDLTIDLSFLGEGHFTAFIFSDGVNADRDATDYRSEIREITGNTKLSIHMAAGGGWAARIVNAQSHSMQLLDKNATEETVHLFHNLDQLSEKHILFGHQHATEYGHGWSGDANRSDVKSVTGSHPAVIGVDFSGLTGRPDSIIERNKNALRQTITATYDRGGVTTVAWHFLNPLSRGGFYWNDSISVPAVRYMIPGGSAHDRYKQILRSIGDFAGSVRGTDGKVVPMIFRPYHEFDGDWFWWGRSHCSTDEFKSLWRFTVSYLRDSVGVHNFIYAFSPDCKFTTEAEYTERYPGDEWVDLVGFDDYADFGRDRYDLVAGVKKLQVVSNFAKRHGKLAAFTETGLESIPNHEWWTGSLLKALKAADLKLCYVLVWRNDARSPTHFYAPFPGQVSAPDFVRFYEDDRTWFEKDLKNIYSESWSK